MKQQLGDSPTVDTVQSIDEYITSATLEAQPMLRQIRETIKAAVPLAQETISYQMPAFKLKRTFIYFAAFNRHIGIYPPVEHKGLRRSLARFANSKGNLRFPIDEPMPYALIGALAKALAVQYSNACDGVQ